MSCESCDCADVYESLFELLNEAVTAQRRAVLVSHIEACPGCFEKLGIERQVSELVRACCCEPAPSALREKIISRLSVTTVHVHGTPQ